MGFFRATPCYVVFIMEKAPRIEEEIDLWTRELGKYFAVLKVESYEQAIRQMKERILVNVRYIIKPGKRDEFLRKVIAQGIIQDSQTEPGNYCYEYSIPVNSENELCLLEQWVSSQAQSAHGKSEHYQRLQALKKEYVIATEIEKYRISVI